MSIRVSVANLVTRIVVSGAQAPSPAHFGILSASALKKNVKRLQALGGGAHLTDDGHKLLVERFGAKDFERDGDAYDARFVIPDERLEEVFAFFERRDARYFEISPIREVCTELAKPVSPDIGPVLESVDQGGLDLLYVDTVRQAPPKAGLGTSSRERDGMQTRRLFHRFDLVVPYLFYLHAIQSPAIFLLREDEVASTEGGCQKGMTKTGIEIADNIF